MPLRNVIEEVIMTRFVVITSRDGDETIHADLLDGIILLITKPNPSKLAELKKGASDESYHLEHSDGELPEPTSGWNCLRTQSRIENPIAK